MQRVPFLQYFNVAQIFTGLTLMFGTGCATTMQQPVALSIVHHDRVVVVQPKMVEAPATPIGLYERKNLQGGYEISLPKGFHLEHSDLSKSFVVYKLLNRDNNILLGLYLGNNPDIPTIPSTATQQNHTLMQDKQVTLNEWVCGQAKRCGDIIAPLSPNQEKTSFLHISYKASAEELPIVKEVIRSFRLVTTPAP